MKTSTYCLAVLLAAGLMVSHPHSASAQEKEKEKRKPKAERKESKRATPFRGTVKSADRNSMSITIEGKDKVQVINVTSETRIMKDGKPATFGDIAAGDEVGVVLKPNADGKENAEFILIQAAKANKDPKKEKEKDGEKEQEKK